MDAPYPAFLAVAGAGLALLPGAPTLALSPDLVLTLFVAPTLLDAAYDSSPRDLRDNWRPIAGGAVIAVILTVLAVAAAARWMRPDMPWPVALVLGAVVAPPDASAATAVLRALRPPHRVLVILEGESLLNDATALLIYRVALGAAIGQWSGWREAPLLTLSIGGGVALGAALGWLYPRLIARIDDVPTSVMFQFIGTFAVWILATRLGLSAIITIVAYAMTVARWSPRRLSARMRIQSYAVWDVAVFVLNVLAFIIAGLQLRPILASVNGVEWPEYAGFGLAVLAVAIVVRVVWVMGYSTAVLWKNRRFGVRLAPRLVPPTWSGGVLIAWCGMRGIVTLATALALPDQFPFRDLILLAAYAVVLGTLVVQGLTLRPLMAVLDLPADDQVEREVSEARRRAAETVLARLDGSTHQSAPGVREAYARRLDGRADPKTDLHAEALNTERRTIEDMRRSGEIGDDAYHVVEQEIDWGEMFVEGRLRALEDPSPSPLPKGEGLSASSPSGRGSG